MKLLQNKVAIITGASRGIGKGIAEKFAEQGCNIAFTFLSSVEKAKAFENEYSARVLNTIASIYASNPNDNQSHFFRNGFKYIPGFDMLSYLASYNKASKKFTTPKAAHDAAQDFESVAKGGGKFTKMGAVKALKDLLNIWKEKEANAKAKNDSDLTAISETKAFIEKAYTSVK